MKVAVVGAGAHSRTNHGPALRRCKEEMGASLALVAVCDLQRDRAERYAADFGFARAYKDLDEMIECERPDGIVAVTPIEHTEAVAEKIMRRAIPLVVEKPPGSDQVQARRLADLADALNAPHMVSFNRRFGPAFARARAWMAQNAERPPLLVASRMLRHARYDERFAPGTAIHAIDNVLAVMGPPLEMVVETVAVGARGTPFFDARVRFAGGAATFVVAPTSGTVSERMEIVGEDYSIDVDVGRCALTIADRGETVEAWSADEAVPEWERNGALDETRAFLRYLREGGWWPTLRDGLRAVEVAEAMQAGRARRWPLDVNLQ